MLLAKRKISEHVFFGNLPSAIRKEWGDMILVDVVGITDYDAYAVGFANIFLYAKSDDSETKKPVKKLDMMESEFDDLLEQDFNPQYSSSVVYRDQGYNANAKYYYNIINIRITVRKITS